MKKLIAGNWKMNGTLAEANALVRGVMDGAEAMTDTCDFVICPPFLHLPVMNYALQKSAVALGGQDCALAQNGAYTGDISAAMLKDIGCNYVILGHSERRQYHGETDADIAKKAKLAHTAGLITIICVGETEAQRTDGMQEKIVGAQLKTAVPVCAAVPNTVIAYEPVWAIGTGKNATPDDVAAMHAFIRGRMKEQVADGADMRILYGGSVKPDNAATLFKVPDVDGALIGGASLKAEQFLAIAKGV